MVAPNSDIVPIQLSLTAGDLITLWAPRWREDGEEWEAFLGDDDHVFAFPDAATLAAFVRSVDEHDLADHPAWPIVRRLSVEELSPEDTQRYDLVGVPEIAAGEPDTWTIGELAEIIAITRSLADTCDLDAITSVLDAAPGLDSLREGTLAFSGRDGRKLWAEIGDVVAEQWDEVLDAVDALVRTPEVSAAALAAARREVGERPAAEAGTDSATVTAAGTVEQAPDTDADTDETGDDDTVRSFWENVGIDPIMISIGHDTWYTLRCYLDDKPVFLGSRGRIDVLGSPRALARHLAGDGAEDHDLTRASTWPEVQTAAGAGELEVQVDPENSYRLVGLGDDLAEGPLAVDSHQLDLAVELLLDVGEWARDETPAKALAPSESLGWLTSFVLNPDPTRLAPSPPFEAEAGRWNALVDELGARLHKP